MSNCKIVVKNLETNKVAKIKDPYIVVKFKGIKKQTKVSPLKGPFFDFNETLIFDVNGDPSPGDVVEFHVYEDEFMRDKLIGTTTTTFGNLKSGKSLPVSKKGKVIPVKIWFQNRRSKEKKINKQHSRSQGNHPYYMHGYYHGNHDNLTIRLAAKSNYNQHHHLDNVVCWPHGQAMNANNIQVESFSEQWSASSYNKTSDHLQSGYGRNVALSQPLCSTVLPQSQCPSAMSHQHFTYYTTSPNASHLNSI